MLQRFVQFERAQWNKCKTLLPNFNYKNKRSPTHVLSAENI